MFQSLYSISQSFVSATHFIKHFSSIPPHTMGELSSDDQVVPQMGKPNHPSNSDGKRKNPSNSSGESSKRLEDEAKEKEVEELTAKLKGGVILEVRNVEEAKIAASAGAKAVIVKLFKRENVWGMAKPSIIREIKEAVSIPVMAMARVGHLIEGKILESIDVSCIVEYDLVLPADNQNHINKHKFRVPFMCGCMNFDEALKRVIEGAAFIRIHGGNTGNVQENVRILRSMECDLNHHLSMNKRNVLSKVLEITASYDSYEDTFEVLRASKALAAKTKKEGRLPALVFADDGVFTPADAALMMTLGCDGVILGSNMFESSDPDTRVRNMVQAVERYQYPDELVGLMEGVSRIDGRRFY